MTNSTSKIKVLAITHYDRANINPFRPEAEQLIGLHQSGAVDIAVMCNPNSILIPYFEQYGIEVITDPLNKKIV